MGQVSGTLGITTYIAEEAPTTNYGTNVNLEVRSTKGGKSGTQLYFSLLNLNALIGAIPAGRTIQSTSKVELYVHTLMAISDDTRLSRAAAWDGDEATATYNNAAGLDATAAFAYAAPGGTGWYSITGADMATMLQYLLDSYPAAAYLLVYVAVTGSGDGVRGFTAYSDDYTVDTAKRPKATIDYSDLAEGYVPQVIMC